MVKSLLTFVFCGGFMARIDLLSPILARIFKNLQKASHIQLAENATQKRHVLPRLEHCFLFLEGKKKKFYQFHLDRTFTFGFFVIAMVMNLLKYAILL